MKPTHWISLMLVCAAGAVACGDDEGATPETDVASAATTGALVATTSPATEPAAATTAPPATTAPAEQSATDELFAESFDDDRNRWGEVDHPEFGTMAFAGGDYVWEFTGSLGHWLPAVLGEQYDRGELDMLDVIVRADMTIDTGKGVAGVFCRESPDTDADWQWYEFVTRDGYAAIRTADSEANLDILAETEDVTLPVGESFAIEASCVNAADGTAQLSMSIDDRVVLEASDDDPLGNGVPGLQAWTYPIHALMSIRWHEFSIRPPDGAAG